MNNLFNQLNPTSAKLPPNLSSMVKMFKSLTNPQAFIQNAVQSNPALKSALEMANGNPEKAFRDMARKMNVDADEIIKMLQ